MVKISNSRVILSLLLTVGVMVGAFCFLEWYRFTFPISDEHFVFQTIEECEQLLTHEGSDTPIIYDTEASADKNARELDYKEFFGFSYQSDTMEYEMFAYVFEDKESALRYFVNRTGESVYLKRLKNL